MLEITLKHYTGVRLLPVMLEFTYTILVYWLGTKRMDRLDKARSFPRF